VEITITGRRLAALDARSAAEATVERLAGADFLLEASGSSTIVMKGLNLAALRTDIRDSATVHADGVAGSQQVSTSGSGSYDAVGLKSETVRLKAADSSDAVVACRDRLEVSVTGAATVQYRGSPEIKESVADAGTLERVR
jgi:hypothetical protein